MVLRLSDKWLWDFWFAQDGLDTHVFYLQANKSLKDESLRHWNVSIGHAVSQNLSDWHILPDALTPSGVPSDGEKEAFDSYTTWTGSIIEHASLWYMFYTGSQLSEKGLVQRIGLATSSDLIKWEKYSSQALIEADPRWYELLDLNAWHDQAWRDPWVFYDDATKQFHALITARSKIGAPDARGVIAHAVSDNLLEWEVLPPLTSPGEFGHMEVPQLVHINDGYYLLFSCPQDKTGLGRIKRLQGLEQGGTHYLYSEFSLGPYRYLSDKFFVGDAIETLYSGKLIQDAAGNYQFLAFYNRTAEGDFLGYLSDPIPIHIEADKQLQLGQRS